MTSSAEGCRLRGALAPPRPAGGELGGVPAHGTGVAGRGVDLPVAWETRPKLHGKPNGEKPERGCRSSGAAAGLGSLRPCLALRGRDGAGVFEPGGSLFCGDSPLLVAVLTLPFLVAALTAGVLIYAALAWARQYWATSDDCTSAGRALGTGLRRDARLLQPARDSVLSSRDGGARGK